MPGLGRIVLQVPELVLQEVIGLVQERDGVDGGGEVGLLLQVLVQGIVAVVGHQPGGDDGRPGAALPHAVQQDVQAGVARILTGQGDLGTVVPRPAPGAHLLGPLLVGVVSDGSVQFPHGIGQERDRQVVVPFPAGAGRVFDDVDAVLFLGGGIMDGAPGVELALEGDVGPFADVLVAGDRHEGGGDGKEEESRKDMVHHFQFNRWRCCSPKCGKPGLTLQESCLGPWIRRHICRKTGCSTRPGSGRLPGPAGGRPATGCPG